MSTDDSARETLEHLQGAVLETIAAARSALDLAEELVRDRAQLAALLVTLGSIAEAVGSALRPPGATGAAAGAGRRTGEDGVAPSGGGPSSGATPGPGPRDATTEGPRRRVEHIPVR